MTTTPTEVAAEMSDAELDKLVALYDESYGVSHETHTIARAWVRAFQKAGYLSPEQLAIRDAETTRRALELAAGVADTIDDEKFNGHGISQAILALRPDPTGCEGKSEEALDAADRAHNRLAYYATMAHNGKAELNGREMSRQVWGAFSDFYAVKHPHVKKIRANSKAIYDAEHDGEPAPWDRNETAPTGWKLVPEELPAENNKKAVKLALSATVLNWPDYMNSLYRVMIGSVK